MNRAAIILVIIGISMIFIAIAFEVIDMLIDHQCYQLTPNEFYQSTICERYWNKQEKVGELMDHKIIKEYLLSKIPIIVDMDSNDLKYDTKNIYFHIYKYILDLEKKVGGKKE